MQILVSILLNAVAVLIASAIIPGIHVRSFFVAAGIAIILGILNRFIRPILVFLTLPATIVTLGLFVFVINAVLVMFAAYVIPGFAVGGFWSALLFSIVLSIINSFLQALTKE